MYGYIYETTNKVNGKKYLGLHKHDIGEVDENYLGSGVLLAKAIKKYGWDNFDCRIVSVCETKEDLSNKEVYWIDVTNAVEDKNYYNLNKGGYGGFDYINKNRLSPTCQGKSPLKGKTGKDAVRYGAILSEITKKLISIANTGRRKVTNGVENRQVKGEELTELLAEGWWHGECNTENKKHTDEWKRQHSEQILGTIRITNVVENSTVKSEDEIPEGWHRGEIHKPKSEEDAKKQKEAASKRIGGTKYMHKGDIIERVLPEFVQQHLEDGFEFGMGPKKK